MTGASQLPNALPETKESAPGGGPSVRVMTAEDLGRAREIEVQSFSQPWTLGMFRDELAQSNCWARVVANERGVVVGYLLGRMYQDLWHVMDLAVDPGSRRLGAGRLLLENFLQAADAARVGVVLEVRASNRPAQRLYLSEGFERVGNRRGYYANDGEDAFIMLRPVTAPGVQG